MMKSSATALLLLLAAGCALARPVPSVNSRSGSAKRGVAYNDAGLVPLFPSSAVSWTYNWASKGDAAAGQEFVPMLFDGVDASWDTNVAAALSSGSKHLLAMNEPDQPISAGGTALSPQLAAQIYQSQMNPYNGKARLGAPAVSAGGISWLQEFAAACNGACHIDFVPLHFYDSSHPDAATQAASLQGWLTETIPQVRSMFKNEKLPIWLTEFAATPTQPVADSISIDYMDTVIPFLDKHVARYAYFSADTLASGNSLNPAGQRYVQG